MTAGITVYNTNNIVQIDETYRNMVLIKSGQYTANDANTNADLWYLNLLTDVWMKTTPHAVLFIKAPSPGITLGPGSYRDGHKVCNFFYPQAQSVTFQYYIYDLVGPALSDRVGLQIFDASSNLVYSAYDYPLRILSMFRHELDPISPTLIYTAPHANIALASAAGGYRYDDDGVDVQSFFKRTYISGANVYAHTVEYANPSTTAVGFYGDTATTLMVLDTTSVPINYTRP